MGWLDTKQQTKPNMPGYLKSFQKDVLKGANNYYDWQTRNPKKIAERSGVYTEPGYALFNKNSETAFDGLTTLAGNNSGGAGMSGNLQSIMTNGGFNPGQTDAMSSVKNLTNNGLMNELINSKDGFTGQQSKAYNALQDTVYGNNQQFQQTFDRGGFDERQAAAYDDLNRTVGNNNAMMGQTLNQGGLTDDQRAAADKYRTTMNSSFDINSNPAYASVRQQALDTQDNALSARAAAAGRYGGGMDQSILAREQGNLANRMDDAEYRNWQQRSDAATGNLAGLGQQGVSNQLGINQAQQQGYQNLGGFGQLGQQNQLAVNSAQQQGLGNIVNTGATGVSQNSNAIGQKAGLEAQLFNMNQAGLGNMGTAYQTAQQPMMTQRAVGQEYENQDQKRINDEMRVNAELDPMKRYQDYLALINGTPTGTTSTTSPSWAQLLAGGGLGVLGLGSMMSGLGGATGGTTGGAIA